MKRKYIIKQIVKILKKNKNLSEIHLIKNLKLKKGNLHNFRLAINYLLQKNIILKEGEIFSFLSLKDLHKCRIVKIFNNYAFAESDNGRYYIKGNLLKGALLNDVCFVKEINNVGQTKEAEVIFISEPSNDLISGNIKKANNCIYFVPDYMPKFFLRIQKNFYNGAKDGDKVMAYVVKRANNHFDHIVRIEKVFGSSNDVLACCYAALCEFKITRRFKKNVIEQAKDIYNNFKIDDKDISYRIDLRNENIFTIDSNESKDLDDAINIKKVDKYYILGVHIADVSHYVKAKSHIDNEAFERGTSVYFANSVIPMLPKELSNGICSLNQNQDRLTFSCFIKIDKNGEIIDYDIKKSIINSKLKGIYSEINKIFDYSADNIILSKYKNITEDLFLLKELLDIMQQKNLKKGVLEIESNETKFIFDNNNLIDITKRSTGISEKIIEHCMILANEVVATFAKENEISFLYRVHEKTEKNKILDLKHLFLSLGIENNICNNQRDILDILLKTKDTKFESFVHKNILRSMKKARYDVNHIGHFGLNLENYSHFTSPIRRYPDLLIHRILSDFLYENKSYEKINNSYKKFCELCAKQSSMRELLAISAERKCESIYKAYFMSKFIGQNFTGKISSVTNFGIYVELDNSVEGLVKIENFPDHQYDYVDGFKYVNLNNLTEYKIGDLVRVKLISTEVCFGNIDFKII